MSHDRKTVDLKDAKSEVLNQSKLEMFSRERERERLSATLDNKKISGSGF